MAAIHQFPDRFQEAKPIIISSSRTSIMVAIEVPRSVLVWHRRFLEMLLAGAVEPEEFRRLNFELREQIQKQDDQERLTQLRESYAPFCRFPAFDKGCAAYGDGNVRNPHDPNTADRSGMTPIPSPEARRAITSGFLWFAVLAVRGARRSDRLVGHRVTDGDTIDVRGICFR
jgi:hypothetical protein